MSYRTAVKSAVLSMIITGATGAAAGQESPVLKSLADEARKRVYVLVRDGVEVLEAGTRRRLARIPLPQWTWVGEEYSCPPDIALGPEGDVLVTSNVVPVLWRINWRTLATTRHPLALDADNDKDIGFTRLRWSPALHAYVATTDLGANWQVDPALSYARKLSSMGATSAPPRAGSCAIARTGS